MSELYSYLLQILMKWRWVTYLIELKISHKDAHQGQESNERTKGELQWRDRKYLKVSKTNHRAKNTITEQKIQ